MFIQTWFLPFLLLATATVIAFPLSRYLAWIMDGKYRPLPVFGWFEKRLDSGPQNWKQYTGSLLIFNTVLFVFGFLVLALQPWMPLNPDGKGMLSPSTIFHSVISFMTNTDLQHYAGDAAPVELQPDLLLHLQSLPVGRHRLLRPGRDHPAPCAAIPRSATSSSTCGGWWSTCSCPSPLSFGLIFHDAGQPDDLQELVSGLDPRAGGHGHHGQGRGEAADHRGRPGGRLRVHEDARDQRRRVLRHELRPPLRESHRACRTSSTPWP